MACTVQNCTYTNKANVESPLSVFAMYRETINLATEFDMMSTGHEHGIFYGSTVALHGGGCGGRVFDRVTEPRSGARDRRQLST